MKRGDRQIKRISAGLEKAVGAAGYPPDMLGTLSMLYDACGRGTELIQRLMNPRAVLQPEKLVAELELHIGDIADLCKDLRVPLRRVVRRANDTRA